MRAGRSFELFPKLFCTVSAVPRIPDSHQSGRDYADLVLHKLCSRAWPSTSLVRMAAMFREVPMTAEQLSFVVSKAIRCLCEVSVDELPPLVYQLLLLAGKGHKAAIMGGIAEQLGQLEAESLAHESQSTLEDVVSSQPSVSTLDRLRPIQGTVMLHIVFAVKQDQVWRAPVRRAPPACAGARA